MVGCMLETKVAIAAGVSLVAAKQNITEADCDSFNVTPWTPRWVCPEVLP